MNEKVRKKNIACYGYSSCVSLCKLMANITVTTRQRLSILIQKHMAFGRQQLPNIFYVFRTERKERTSH